MQGQSGIKRYLKNRSEKKQNAIDKGDPFLSILAGPGYTPDNGALIGGGFLYTFKTNKTDSLIQRSSVPLNLFYSTKGNIGIKSKLKSFWNEDKIRFNLNLNATKAQDNYFGVGFESADQIDLGDDTSKYDRVSYQISPEFLYRLKRNFYVGALFDLNSTDVKEANSIMLNDPYYQEYGPKNLNIGLGVSLNYDSRDIAVNAYKGYFAKFGFTNYSKSFGSDNNYSIFELDFRTYHTITRPGNTFAVKLYGRFGTGNVPYAQLSTLGGNDGLRGYLTGKYIEKTAVFAIPEWRYMFLKKDGSMSKHGFATWVGLGTIAESISKIEKFVPNVGLGYRFEVQPRMNVRIDYGIGKQTSGLYFNFTEAF